MPAKAHFSRQYRRSAGPAACRRSDIELLYEDLPEPIDLELDSRHRMIYWTDRGDPPRGNTVNRAPMDPSPPASARSPRFCSRT